MAYVGQSLITAIRDNTGSSRSRFNKKWAKTIPFLLMFPALAVMGLFALFPVINAFRLSLFDKQLLNPGETFVGLDHYSQLFANGEFINALKVSVIYVAGSVALQFLVGLALAALLSAQGVKGKRFFRTAFIVPYTLSELVVSLIWLQMLDTEFGIINYFATLLGADPQNWLFDFALPAVIVANVWWGSTFSLLMLESAMQGIPKELYEAAEVDGCTSWGKFIHITLPSIRYVSLLNMIMITLYTINSFGIIFVLTAGGPLGSTDVIGMFMWRSAFQFMDLGLGATISTLIFVVNILITLVYIRLFGLNTLKEGA